MKKEQILLIVAAVIVALLVWGNSGMYESVNAAATSKGKDVEVSTSDPYDPLQDIQRDAPRTDRNLLRQLKMETRLEFPTDMPSPGALAPVWNRPLPAPAPHPATWSDLRHRIQRIGATAPPEEGEDGAAPPEDEDEDEGDLDESPLEKKKTIDLGVVAKLVRADGSEIPGEISPKSRFKDEPLWVLLEAWPAVTFSFSQYNRNANGSFIGTIQIGSDEAANYELKLPKGVENDFHAERIQRGVTKWRPQDGRIDRQGLVDLADWAMGALPGEYSVAGVRLAIEAYEKAKAISTDLALVRKLGAAYRKAYDLEGELRVYREFMDQGHAEDPAVLKLVAGAYEQVRAWGPARVLWERAADSGDLEARLGLALNFYGSGELDIAATEFEKAQGAGDTSIRARALSGIANVMTVGGRAKEAVAFARRATEAAPSERAGHDALGAALYYSGDFAAAATSFETAAALSPEGDTRSRSSRGFALAAAGQLDQAGAEFERCRAEDALNFFDPVVGMGDVEQRRGRLTDSNDLFEEARRRDPQNPWILLRLGTAKLRDGVPAAALEYARTLVGAAPSCVDGLRLAGLAAAATSAGIAADDPDPEQRKKKAALDEEAVRHLGRAFAKESHPEILFQYAKALIAAGQADEALRLLEEHTNVRNGMARRDAKSLALLAYSRFVRKADMPSVIEAIDRGARSDPDEETKQLLADMKKTIVDWDRKRMWTDDFRRAPGQNVFGGWEEDDQRLGVAIGLAGEHVVAKGLVRDPATNRKGTRLTRVGALKTFIWAEAAIKVSPDTECVFHLVKGNLPSGEGGRAGRGGTELGIAVDRNGRVLLISPTGAGRKTKWGMDPVTDADGNELQWPQDGGFHVVRIERVDERKGTFQLYLDDEPLAEQPLEVGALKRQGQGEYTLGFNIDADGGTNVEVIIDYVRLVRTVN